MSNLGLYESPKTPRDPTFFASPSRQCISVDHDESFAIGFSAPCFLTRAVYERCVAWTSTVQRKDRLGLDEDGRLRDMLCMAYLTATTHPELPSVPFSMYVVPQFGSRPMRTPLKLAILHDPFVGDCYHISFPWEEGSSNSNSVHQGIITPAQQ